VEVGGVGGSSKPKSNSLMDIEDYSNDSFNADTENSKVKIVLLSFFLG
jgi:hypothetical protein